MARKKTNQEIAIEEERLKQIHLLLEQLFKREEVTAKAIVGCLYDIATINLINKYIPFWGINPTVKYLTRFPRPVAQWLGVKLYLQPKCPKLITDWLYSLVEFPPQPPQHANSQVLATDSSVILEKNLQEIKSLRQKVQFLTGTLITTVVVFTGSFFWIAHNLHLNPIELLSPTSSNSRDERVLSPLRQRIFSVQN
ncbi:MAG: hypothetical protein NZ901_07405 [Geminocystis sp.]|nr:hypothetical protein [Geminocystis sp.]HIK36404.1 hypothetical protein [Geminocystis sp. M7585_C2015_104]MCS7147999.1 hypothetical protein [Geminocystis sp.]MCX8078974.1 hypothetical protein [Geminocystis sp.]MDW8116921.1 hypothetical protein [Geminocystis sp.]